MKTNLEKWDYYMTLINENASDYADTISRKVPKRYWFVYPTGKMVERTILARFYHFEFDTFYRDKKPTQKEVKAIRSNANIVIDFKPERLYFKYEEPRSTNDQVHYFTSSVMVLDLINSLGGNYLNQQDAEIAAVDVKAKHEAYLIFKETHKKDANYDYRGNGYKFLGWSNVGQPAIHTEYTACIGSKHQRIEVQHTRSGSENTVSCPVCKIYWKYDCSD